MNYEKVDEIKMVKRNQSPYSKINFNQIEKVDYGLVVEEESNNNVLS